MAQSTNKCLHYYFGSDKRVIFSLFTCMKYYHGVTVSWCLRDLIYAISTQQVIAYCWVQNDEKRSISIQRFENTALINKVTSTIILKLWFCFNKIIITEVLL